jgi:hypothetical protein
MPDPDSPPSEETRAYIAAAFMIASGRLFYGLFSRSAGTPGFSRNKKLVRLTDLLN